MLDVYRLWRPSPLYRAHRLEKALGTPAHIYYKYEGVSPAGSHKPNTAVPQAYYNARSGVRTLTTETGAGQWGTALAFACAQFGLECEVWQVGASYDQKPYRALADGDVRRDRAPQPVRADRGRPQDPRRRPRTTRAASASRSARRSRWPRRTRRPHYALGSVLNHVLLHQTVIGEEALLQLAMAGDVPDVIVGCTGGGSNFAGLAFPFLREKLAGRMDPVIRAVEPASCPSLTRGRLRVRLRRHRRLHAAAEDAHARPRLHPRPDPRRRPALPRHGPLISHVYELGLMEAIAIGQTECFDAAVTFARTEGIVPAPEPTHALAACIREAMACQESGEEKVILTALCGHGHFDMAAYDAYLGGSDGRRGGQRRAVRRPVDPAAPGRRLTPALPTDRYSDGSGTLQSTFGLMPV